MQLLGKRSFWSWKIALAFLFNFFFFILAFLILNFFSCTFSTAGYNNLEVAEYLLEHGADVNAQDKGGLIPLHNAASYGVGAGSLTMSRTAWDSLKSYPKPVILQMFCFEHSSGFD